VNIARVPDRPEVRRGVGDRIADALPIGGDHFQIGLEVRVVDVDGCTCVLRRHAVLVHIGKRRVRTFPFFRIPGRVLAELWDPRDGFEHVNEGL